MMLFSLLRLKALARIAKRTIIGSRYNNPEQKCGSKDGWTAWYYFNRDKWVRQMGYYSFEKNLGVYTACHRSGCCIHLRTKAALLYPTVPQRLSKKHWQENESPQLRGRTASSRSGGEEFYHCCMADIIRSYQFKIAYHFGDGRGAPGRLKSILVEMPELRLLLLGHTTHYIQSHILSIQSSKARVTQIFALQTSY